MSLFQILIPKQSSQTMLCSVINCVALISTLSLPPFTLSLSYANSFPAERFLKNMLQILWTSVPIFTSHKQSHGKVMFFIGVCQSFCPQGWEGWVSLVPCNFQGWVPLVPDPFRGGWICPGDWYPPPGHGTCDTTGYGRQAGGKHPNEMVSCYYKCSH